MPITIGRFRKQAPEERPRCPIANRDSNSTSFRTPVVSNLWFSTASPPGGRPLKNKKAGLSSGLIEMRTKLLNSLVNRCGAADIRHQTHAKHCILHCQQEQLTSAPISHQSPVLGTRLGTALQGCNLRGCDQILSTRPSRPCIVARGCCAVPESSLSRD